MACLPAAAAIAAPAAAQVRWEPAEQVAYGRYLDRVQVLNLGRRRVVLSWAERDAGRWRFKVAYRDVDGSWQAPLTAPVENGNSYHDIALSPDGRVAVTWISRGAIWAAAASSTGLWGEPVLVAPAVAGETLIAVRDGPGPIVEWMGSDLVLAWIASAAPDDERTLHVAEVTPAGVRRQELTRDTLETLQGVQLTGTVEGGAAVMWGGSGAVAGLAAKRPGGGFVRLQSPYTDPKRGFFPGALDWESTSRPLFSIWLECYIPHPEGDPGCDANRVYGDPFGGVLRSDPFAYLTVGALAPGGRGRLVFAYGIAVGGEPGGGAWVTVGDEARGFGRPIRLSRINTFEVWAAATQRGRGVVVSETDEGDNEAWVVAGQAVHRFPAPRHRYGEFRDLFGIGGEHVLDIWARGARVFESRGFVDLARPRIVRLRVTRAGRARLRVAFTASEAGTAAVVVRARGSERLRRIRVRRGRTSVTFVGLGRGRSYRVHVSMTDLAGNRARRQSRRVATAAAR